MAPGLSALSLPRFGFGAVDNSPAEAIAKNQAQAGELSMAGLPLLRKPLSGE